MAQLPIHLNLRYPSSKLNTPVKQSMHVAGLKDHLQNVVRGMLKNKKKKLNITPLKSQPLGGNPLKLSLRNSIRGSIDAAGQGMFKGKGVRGKDISGSMGSYGN